MTAPAPQPVPASRREIVLFVEDDTGLRLAIDRLLAASGFCASSFSSAEAALEARPTLEADCFVFDVRLPGIDGFALHAELARLGLLAPVIFITAHDTAENRERAARAGAAMLLPKPFEGPDLVAAIRRAIDARPDAGRSTHRSASV